MSEYWKSTPKYWCKHCKTFVRDTKLEKSNHEATPKHQGNLKRFLRDLHRGHEKDEKDKERARAEIARLNGISPSPGMGSSLTAGSAPTSASAYTTPVVKPRATEAQRKQQMNQLAEMGISIPDEFRGDLAMAGEWQVTSERIVDEDEGEKKVEAVALGVRKREDRDEDDEDGDGDRKRKWGSRYKTHPAVEGDGGDLDVLLSNVIRKDKVGVKEEAKVKLEARDDEKREEGTAEQVPEADKSKLKSEPSEGDDVSIPNEIPSLDVTVKEEASSGIVFKKRKAKNIRQK